MSTCRHYNTPRGCLYPQCRFIHGSPPQADGNVFRKPGVFPSAHSTALRSQQLPFPPGTCRFYYNFGYCRHGEQCKYKHVLPENPVPNESFGLASPFFSDAATPSPAEEVTISATDASRLLDTYCAPSFSFTKPTEMVLFVKILISAEPKKWDDKDAQKVLEKVTETPGAARIEYILSYPRIVSRIQAPDEISFASTYLGCLSYMVTDFAFLLDSCLVQRVDSLFGIFNTHYARFNEIVTICMQEMVSRSSFDDPGGEKGSGAAIFNTLSLVLTQYLIRFKSALREHSSLPLLVHNLSQWFDSWKIGGFVDGWVPENEHVKNITIDRLQLQITRLVAIVQREADLISRKDGNAHNDGHLRLPPEGYHQREATAMSPPEIQSDPAGNPRKPGARYVNDLKDIQAVLIPPKQNELVSPAPPFQSAKTPGRPPPYSGSMERLLDFQFRLLQEGLLAPVRVAVGMVFADLLNETRNTSLQPILDKKGGLYIAQTGQMDSIMIKIYTSVNPLRIATDNRGTSVELMMDTPPGSARNTSATRRIEYWRAVSRKRLMQGGLIGVIWQTGQEIQLFFGLIASSAHEVQSSVEDNNETMRLRVKFFDPSIHVKVIEWCQHGQRTQHGTRILLVEAPIMYEQSI